MEIVQAVAIWSQDTLRSRALRPRTLEGYVYSLMSLARYGIADTNEIDRPTMARYLLERRERGITSQTCRRVLAAACSLAEWLSTQGRFSGAILEDMRLLWKQLPTPAPLPPRFLTPEEFGRFLRAAAAVHPILADAILVAVHTGLRLGELRALHGEDLFFGVPEPYVKVTRDADRENKTYRERTVPVSVAFAQDFGRRAPKEGPIFVSRPGGRGHATDSPYLADATIRRWMWVARASAGFGRDVNFITCRHTYASWLVQADVSIAKVAKWLGNSIAVCFRNYASLAPGGDSQVERGFRLGA